MPQIDPSESDYSIHLILLIGHMTPGSMLQHYTSNIKLMCNLYFICILTVYI